MNRVVWIIALVLLASSFAGCKSIPLYGHESCKKGQTAYVGVHARAAICLPSDQVYYILCVRELGLSEVNETRTSELVADAAVVAQLDASIKAELAEKLEAKWATDEKLTAARAKAIEACLELTKGGVE